MPPTSAGLLLCRHHGDWAFLLAHHGGPLFARRDDGWWTLPKGLIEPGESPLHTACREFHEETGFAVPEGPFHELGTIRQRSGKRVHGFAAVGDADPALLSSNPFEMEWPPRSGLKASFPEIDRVGWYGLADARRKLIAAQHPFLERALRALR